MDPLPDEIWLNVFDQLLRAPEYNYMMWSKTEQRLTVHKLPLKRRLKQLVRLMRVCRQWYNILCSNTIWRQLCIDCTSKLRKGEHKTSRWCDFRHNINGSLKKHTMSLGDWLQFTERNKTNAFMYRDLAEMVNNSENNLITNTLIYQSSSFAFKNYVWVEPHNKRVVAKYCGTKSHFDWVIKPPKSLLVLMDRQKYTSRNYMRDKVTRRTFKEGVYYRYWVNNGVYNKM